MCFLILGWSVGLKKKKPINNHKKSRNRRPGTPGCGCGAWKQQDMNPENQYSRKVGWCYCKMKTTWETLQLDWYIFIYLSLFLFTLFISMHHSTAVTVLASGRVFFAFSLLLWKKIWSLKLWYWVWRQQEKKSLVLTGYCVMPRYSKHSNTCSKT